MKSKVTEGELKGDVLFERICVTLEWFSFLNLHLGLEFWFTAKLTVSHLGLEFFEHFVCALRKLIEKFNSMKISFVNDCCSFFIWVKVAEFFVLHSFQCKYYSK